MPSKKNILHRLGELEKSLKDLKVDVEEHYEPKDIIIKNETSDLSVEILANGWTSIIAENGDKRISLGHYPNQRFQIIERMFEALKQSGER